MKWERLLFYLPVNFGYIYNLKSFPEYSKYNKLAGFILLNLLTI